MAADSGDVVFDLEDFLGVCHLVETQFLCHLGTHLGGVAVNGLTASDDDVDIANLLDGGGEGIRSGEGVGACEEAVGEQPARVGSTEEALADDLTGARRAHGEHADGAAWMLLFEAQGLFKGIQVFGVEDGGQGGAVDGAFRRHRVFTHISSIGHLLGKHHDFQCFCHKIKISFSIGRQRYSFFP